MKVPSDSTGFSIQPANQTTHASQQSKAISHGNVETRFIGDSDLYAWLNRAGTGIRRSKPRSTVSLLFVDPADRSKNKVTRDLALAQTAAARNILYRPGEVLRREIGRAASALHHIVMQLKDTELKILTVRLFGQGGLLPGESPKALCNILARLMTDGQSAADGASATDRTAFISVMGDIGTLYMNAAQRRCLGVPDASSKKTALRKRLSEVIVERGLCPISDAAVDRIRLSGDSRVVGPRKRAEQPSKTEQGNARKSSRTGVHNLGSDADDQLGIHEKFRIPKVCWPLAHIDATRVLNTQEPLVDHMSGSPAKILMVWDMLCGLPADELYTGVLEAHQTALNANVNRVRPMEHLGSTEQEARLARVAGACGMLVGVGYHSAVEVAEGALKYIGQNLRGALGEREDAADLLGAGAATDLILELFETQMGRNADR